MRNFLFYLLCAFIPFENTALAMLGGVFTAPLGIVLMPFIIMSIVMNTKLISALDIKILKSFFIFSLYSLSVLVIFYDDYDMIFLFDRGIRFMLLIIPHIAIFIYSTRQTNDTLIKGVFIMFCIILLSFILNLTIPNVVNNTSIVQHTSAFSPDRLRGFTLEASTFGFQFVLVILMMLSIKKNISIIKDVPTILIYGLIVICCIAITSRGTLICFLLTAFLTYVVLSKSSFVIKAIGGSILAVIAYVIFDAFLLNSFISDIEKYNSIATRSSVLLTSVISLLTNPFGYGFFGFLPAMYENGLVAIDVMDAAFPSLFNFNEFALYLRKGETLGVSTKSFFFDWLIFAGLPFLWLYLKSLRYFTKQFIKEHSEADFSVFVFLIVCTMFFIPIEVRYIASFCLAFLYCKTKSGYKDEKNQKGII